MKVEIQKATPGDIPAIMEFIRHLAVFEKMEEQVTATEAGLKETLFGEQKYAEVIFLKEGNTKVGFAIYFYKYSTFMAKPVIHLEDLFVLPEFRGRGYGKLLLSYLAEVTVKRGCSRLEWWVLDWNSSAIEFYKSIGAETLEEWQIERLSGSALNKLAKFKHLARK